MLISSAAQLKHISPKEQLKQMYENTDSQLDQYRFSDHYDLQDVKKRTGQLMPYNELIRRVEKITHKRVWAEQSRTNPNVMGFYTTKNRIKSYVCAFEKAIMPEFSLLVVDAADLPIKETRGWRTVVSRLLQAKAITWGEMLQAFGDTDSQASARWRFNTKDFRK